MVLDGWLGRARTAGDGGPPRDAVLAAASYRDHGEDGFDRLAGDWVSVVWDPSRGRLVCARAALPCAGCSPGTTGAGSCSGPS